MRDVRELVGEFGTPLYVYDVALVREAVAALRTSLPAGTALYYSLKANPHPAIVETVLAQGCRAEVTSIGELDCALGVGAVADACLYTGPGKSAAALSRALAAGVRLFSVESQTDLGRLAEVAAGAGVTVDCLIRVNAAASGGSGLRMTGTASQFGVDVDAVAALARGVRDLPSLRVCGAHFFPITNAATEDALIAELVGSVRTAAWLREQEVRLDLLDLGGGFVARYAQPGPPLRYGALAGALTGALDEHLPGWRNGRPRIAVESGRHLVAAAGTLVTTVLGVKSSHGNRYVVLDAGINHLGGMSGLGRLLPMSAQPNQACSDPHGDPVHLVGPLCTPVDVLGRGVALAGVRPGDVLSVANVGAYGLSASLVAFLSHPAPTEVISGGRVLSASRIEVHRVPVTVHATVPRGGGAMRTEHTLSVTFAGARAGEGPATWGQTAIWQHIEWFKPDDHVFNIRFAFPLRRPVPVDQVSAAVSALLARHESLRTTYELSGGRLRQVVHAKGEIPLRVVELGDRDPQPVVAELRDRVGSASFDLRTDWPVRLAVLTSGGAAHTVVYAVSHVAADGGGARVLTRELARLLDAGPDTGAGWQPFDLAEYETSAEGQAISAAAARHWHRTLTNAPAHMFPGATTARDQPRYWMLRPSSPAMQAAVHRVAATVHVTTSLVYLTAVTALLAEYTDADGVLLKLVASNRLAEHRHTIAALAQDGVFAVARPTGTFADAIKQCWGASALAYRHARYAPEDVAAVIAEVNRFRGVEVDLTNHVNDRRRDVATDATLAEMTRDEVYRLLPRTTIEVAGTWSRQDSTVLVTLTRSTLRRGSICWPTLTSWRGRTWRRCCGGWRSFW